MLIIYVIRNLATTSPAILSTTALCFEDISDQRGVRLEKGCVFLCLSDSSVFCFVEFRVGDIVIKSPY